MKKIIISASIILAVAAVAIGVTTAFYSDTETSRGNTLTAGAIDLGIDNHSFYNGHLNEGTTWRVDYDIEHDAQGNSEVHHFWDFGDLKPGDWGEDTISLHVNNNDSWLCADVTLTSNNDNGITEPEGNDGDVTDGAGNGELASHVKWYWWNDDGDNVFEGLCPVDANGVKVDPNCVDEVLLPGSGGTFGLLGVGNTAHVTLADSTNNIWTGLPNNPLSPDSVRFVGKAFCFGDSTMAAYPQDGSGDGSTNGPVQRPVVCNGANENNVTQTDSMTADVTFRAVQSRHNDQFSCQPPVIVE